MKKAIILDLDNTIYPVESIGNELFADLFQMIRQSDTFKGDFDELKKEIMRRPFQKVAKKFGFDKELTSKGTQMMRELSYDKKMKAFDDYAVVKKLQATKFLVTAGFTKMQQAKVDQLGLASDFDEIFIIDSDKTNNSKKDVFLEIIKRRGYKNSEVLIVGDDAESEIQAAKEIGVDGFLYDKDSKGGQNVISDFSQLIEHFE